MDIFFFINKWFLYKYQVTIIEEISCRFPDAKIYLAILADANFNYKWQNKSLLKIIDRRFSNLICDPLDQVELKKVQVDNPDIILLKDIENIQKPLSIDWAVYLYPDPESSPFLRLTIRNLLKFSFDENYWSYCCLTKQEVTYISILRFSSNSKEWELFNSLKFSTQTGIINNRSKALFYFSIMLAKTLEQILPCTLEVKNKTYRLSNSFRYLNLLKYYSILLILIVFRKISKKRLNWKIAVKQNNNLCFLKQPEGSFWADPFIIKKDNLFIFIEDFNYETNLGEIALLELNDKFVVNKKSTTLKEDFHLSFPNVFKFDEEFYMMPETSSINNVCIYKSDNFPYEWTLYSEIISGIKLIDAVWFFHNGYYWLFANKIHSFETDNNECLYLYYSMDLFSKDWISHPLNPVIVDSGKSRNAGQIFIEDGKIYRPSQNCKQTYGASVNINEIIELSPDKYLENTKYIIKPEMPFLGVHTYNKSGDLEVLDFLKKE